VALWSLGSMANRFSGKGHDPSCLGRWVWARYGGRNSTNLRIFTPHRPSQPQGGAFTVYAQHRQALMQQGGLRCPRQAFCKDLAKEIAQAQDANDSIIVILNGNESMVSGVLRNLLQNQNLKDRNDFSMAHSIGIYHDLKRIEHTNRRHLVLQGAQYHGGWIHTI